MMFQVRFHGRGGQGTAAELLAEAAFREGAELAGGFDAAFVAVGAHIGRGAYIPVGEGCGLCATECPCGAIEMEPEQT